MNKEQLLKKLIKNIKQSDTDTAVIKIVDGNK